MSGRRSLDRLFPERSDEGSRQIEAIDGSVPRWIRGTYLSNGPGVFARGEVRYRNWLDGDGLISSLRFDASGIHHRRRIVRGTKAREEEAAGRALFRTFGTGFPGDRLRHGVQIESPLNVSVFAFADRLLAFGEQGLPVELDPETLESRGAVTFERALTPLSPFAGHPSFDPETGEMLNVGVSYASDRPLLHLYRFDAAGRRRYRSRLPLPYPCSVHDFSMSRRFAVVHLSPYLLDMERLIGEGSSVMDALEWRPELGSRLLIAERADGARVASIAIGHRYCLHHVNAFEVEDELVVDLIELERPVYDQYEVLPDLYRDPPAGWTVRYRIDTRHGKLLEKAELAFETAPDFPAIDRRRETRACEECWMLGMSSSASSGPRFFDRLVHLRWDGPRVTDLYEVPRPYVLATQPVFVPAPEGGGRRDRGVLVCQLVDTESGTSAYALLDAGDVAAGPLATVRLERPLRPGFHAVFVPG